MKLAVIATIVIIVLVLIARAALMPFRCDVEAAITGKVLEECSCLGVKKTVTDRQDLITNVCIGIVTSKTSIYIY